MQSYNYLLGEQNLMYWGESRSIQMKFYKECKALDIVYDSEERWAGPRNVVRDLPRGLSQASCVIMSGFRAALDLDTNPLSNLICPRFAERAKPGRGKPVLIMHIGFFACFNAISLECSRFSKIATLFVIPL